MQGLREFRIARTEDGLVIEIKGDKETIQRRREAIEAFREFRRKFWEAFGPHSWVESNGGRDRAGVRAAEAAKETASTKAAAASEMADEDDD